MIWNNKWSNISIYVHMHIYIYSLNHNHVSIFFYFMYINIFPHPPISTPLSFSLSLIRPAEFPLLHDIFG